MKTAHDFVFFTALHAAVNDAGTAGKSLRQMAQSCLGSSLVEVFAFLDERTHPICFLILRQCALQSFDQLVKPVARHGSCIDTLPAGWLFGQPGDIHIAIKSKTES